MSATGAKRPYRGAMSVAAEAGAPMSATGAKRPYRGGMSVAPAGSE